MAKKKAESKKPAAEPALVQEHRTAEERAEQVLTRVAESGQDWPSPDEWPIFDSLNLNRFAVERKIERTKTRVKWQEVAGSTSDRKRAEEALTDARAKLDSEAPDIQAELSRMRELLRELEEGVSIAEKELRERSEAVQHVRQLLPDSVRRRADREIAEIKREARKGEDYQEFCKRRGFLKGFVHYELSPALEVGQHLTSAQRDEQRAVRDYLAKHELTEREWPSHRAELQDELQEIQSFVAKEERAFLAEKEAIEAEAIAPFVE